MKKSFKAYLIDVNAETVTLVNVDKVNGHCLTSIYKFLDCSCMTVATQYDNGDAIFVNDEGLLTQNEESKFFEVEGAHQPFIGNGLLMGSDEEGDTQDIKTDFEEFKRKIKFLSIKQIRNKYL